MAGEELVRMLVDEEEAYCDFTEFLYTIKIASEGAATSYLHFPFLSLGREGFIHCSNIPTHDLLPEKGVE